MKKINNSLHYTLLSGLLVAALMFASVSQAAVSKTAVGQPFPITVAQDQHEKDVQLSQDVRYVLISFDMSTGKQANQYLSAKGQSFLDKHHAVFMANIYGMPWIGRKFALPKMKKYKHRILLLDKEGLLDGFPEKEGEVIVFELDAVNTIIGVRYWDPATALIFNDNQ